MGSKKVYYEQEAQKGLLRGISKLSRAVSGTLGAKGRNVLIEDPNGGMPFVTNDGVTIAKNFSLSNRLENQGVKVLRGIATKTDDDAGDGTTTSIVISESIIRNGLEKIKTGVNPIFVNKGIEKAVTTINEYLNKISLPITLESNDVLNVATISANNDSELGQIITNAFKKVGQYGTVKIEDSKTGETYIDYKGGLSFPRGFVSPYFATDPVKGIADLNNPYILITDHIIKDLSDFSDDNNGEIPLFTEILHKGKPLVIIGDNIELRPMQELLHNKMTKNINFIFVKAPEFGARRNDILEDIATVTGGKFITSDKGLELTDITFDDLGQAEHITISDNETIIINGKGSKKEVDNRIEMIKEQLKVEDEEYGKHKLTERLSKLSGGIAIIKVGGNSDTEILEKKYRVEDAVNAVKSALSDGIVGGGGTALYHFDLEPADITNQKDEQVGVEIILNAIKEPLKNILKNAGVSDKEKDIEKLSNKSDEKYYIGYDVKNDKLGNMVDLGVIDPTKTVKTALQNASSVAGMILTTHCVLIEDTDDKKDDLTLSEML